MMNQQSMSPLVSIALCTYNGAAFLDKQLETILQQTYTNLEVIIVDDASTDDTIHIIKSYSQQDERIRFFQNQSNAGFNKNFEKAVLQCKGDYIAIADQDDIWELHKIETMMMKWPADCIFIYSLSKDFTGEEPLKNEKNKVLHYYNGSDAKKLFFNSPIHGHASMFHRSLLKDALPFPPDVFYDWWLSVVASSVGKVGCIGLTLTYHRVHPDNSSRNIVNISDKNERLQLLRTQRLHFINMFLKKPFVQPHIRSFLLRYKKRLEDKKDNSFSLTLFLFNIRNSHTVFHYKRTMNVLSLLKNSFKRARTGL